MPVLLKKDEWRIKNPLSGNYTGAAILSTTLPEDAAQIIENTQAALNLEELRAEQVINNTQNAVNGINSQSDMILESISKAIHNGTDTTLEIEGMPADAKATGNLKKKLMKLPAENDYGENGQYPRSTGTGIEWVDYIILKQYNNLNRPTVTEIGTMIFDTTLNKPIWWDGSKWIDANGAGV